MTAMIFILFVAMLLIGMALPAAIGLATVFGFQVAGININLIWSGMIRQLNSYGSIAIPFFIFSGNLMSKGSIAKQLLNVCQTFAGKKRLTAGLVTIVVCAFFAALSGSSVATVAAIGPITYPLMIAMGYEAVWAAAIVAAGAIVGPIIPPSVALVVYGISTNTSISALFMGGIIPGILVSISFGIAIKLTQRGRIDLEVNHKMLESIPDRITPREKLLVLWKAKWALFMPILVLGGIYGGIFTPTEASVIATVYVLLVGLIERSTSKGEIREAMIGTIKSTGGLMLILAVAQAFGYVVALNQVPEKVISLMSGIDSPWLVLLLINIILLITGCFMEALSAIVILTPILYPLALSTGLDALQFGLIMCVNLVIGTITPPFGLNVFVASSITGQPTYRIFKRTAPFMISSIIVLMLITYLPQIISLLPNLLG